ncbi:hypothetical protein GCM10009867_12270 [Pedococcus aerophilus]|uniref:Uncharacterized protein n=1 Tax=Pedococcus aerophilus TaxID=436356 RepID=A0ABN3UKH5_9MICO
MSFTPQPTSTARSTSAHAGPLQTVLAAVAVCVLYWAVSINDTPAANAGSGAAAVHLQQVGNTSSVHSAVPAAFSVSGQVR